MRSSDGFHYDLFYGGGVEPEKFLSDQRQIEALKRSIKTINEYEEALINKNLYEIL